MSDSPFTTVVTLDVGHTCPSLTELAGETVMYANQIKSFADDQKSAELTSEVMALLVARRCGCQCPIHTYIGASFRVPPPEGSDE